MSAREGFTVVVGTGVGAGTVIVVGYAQLKETWTEVATIGFDEVGCDHGETVCDQVGAHGHVGVVAVVVVAGVGRKDDTRTSTIDVTVSPSKGLSKVRFRT
jgi:hypothetical protein